MRTVGTLLIAIAIQVRSLPEALAQSAPSPEPSQTSLSGITIIVLLIIGLLIGGVVTAILLRKSRDRRFLEQRPHPPEPPQQDLQKTQDLGNRSLMPSSSKTESIFISYRRQDSADITGRIYDRLIERCGTSSVFKDVDAIPLGVDFRKYLQDSVSKCNILLAVVGKSWLEARSENGKRCLEDPRDYLRIEIETALQRDIPVIPVLVQGAGMPHEEELPSALQALAYRNAIAVRPDPDFRADMDRLISGIQAHLKATK
jgi:hypothetical protein